MLDVRSVSTISDLLPPNSLHTTSQSFKLQRAQVIAHKGIVGSVNAGSKLPLKSLSHHYFWIDELHQRQRCPGLSAF